MNERTHATRISRELDDAGSPGMATPAEQRMVHRHLSRRDQLPWIPSPANLREEILNAVSESTSTPIPLELPRLRPTPWGLVVAAMIAMALGVGVLVGLRLAPLAQETKVAQTAAPRYQVGPEKALAGGEVQEYEEGHEHPVADPLAFLPTTSQGSPIQLGLSKVLRGEVSRVSSDAKRAIDTMLGPLPLTDGD